MTDTPRVKPIPDPVYSCKFCAYQQLTPAEGLWWSKKQQGLVCEECWDYSPVSEEQKGVSLAMELEARNVPTLLTAEDRETLMRLVTYSTCCAVPPIEQDQIGALCRKLLRGGPAEPPAAVIGAEDFYD